MKIGIFGGSFNPPHYMHKNIALKLIENKLLDKVIYVPTGDKYNKNDLVLSTHRYNMLKLMCKNNHNIEVSDYELKNDLVYTYQTLDYFKKIYKNSEIYFICGTDNLKNITTWKNYEYILKNYKVLVVTRNDDIGEIFNNIKYKDNIIVANISKLDISSTIIRNNIKNKNYGDIIDYIDKDILEYIVKNDLYT